MGITVACGACHKRFTAPDRYAGKRVKCPGCAQPINIPAPPTPSGDLFFGLSEHELSAAESVPMTRPAAARAPQAAPARQATGPAAYLLNHKLALVMSLLMAILAPLFAYSAISTVVAAGAIGLVRSGGSIIWASVGLIIAWCGMVRPSHGGLPAAAHHREENAQRIVGSGLLLYAVAISLVLVIRALLYRGIMPAVIAAITLAVLVGIQFGILALIGMFCRRFGFFPAAAWSYIIMMGMVGLLFLIVFSAARNRARHDFGRPTFPGRPDGASYASTSDGWLH